MTPEVQQRHDDLGLTISKQKGNVNCSIDSGIDEIMMFWDSVGVNTEGMHLCDASGLSRYNALTPRQLVK